MAVLDRSGVFHGNAGDGYGARDRMASWPPEAGADRRDHRV